MRVCPPSVSLADKWSWGTSGLLVLLGVLEVGKLGVMACSAPAFPVYDAATYWQLGTQVAAGDVWMVRDPVAHRTPGYPWVLGLVQAVGGHSAWPVLLGLQYLAVGVTTGLTAWYAGRLTGRASAVCAAAVLCVLCTARPSYASVLLTESLFTLVWTATVFALTVEGVFEDTRSTVFVAGGWGLACLLRPAALALAPAWWLAWWWRSDQRLPPRGLPMRWWQPVLLTVGIWTALCGPWMARNAQLFGRPAFTVFLGRELWVAAFGPGGPPLPYPAHTAEGRRLAALLPAHLSETERRNNWAVSQALRAAGLTDVQTDDLMRHVAWQAIAQAPLSAGSRWGQRSIDFWRSVYSRAEVFGTAVEQAPQGPAAVWSHAGCTRLRDAWLDRCWESRLLTVELFSLISVLGLVGLWLSPHTQRRGAILTVAVGGLVLVTTALEYPTYRYRMVLEPVLIAATVAGWGIWSAVVRLGVAALWSPETSQGTAPP